MKTIIQLSVVVIIACILYFFILPFVLKKHHQASPEMVRVASGNSLIAKGINNSNVPSGHKSDSAFSGSIVISDSTTMDRIREIYNNYKLANSSAIAQAEFAAGLVKDLCKQGLTDEAWEFIEPGSGVMRNMQLVEFFKNAKLSRNEIIGKLGSLQFKQDLGRGLDGYLLRIKPSDYVKEISSAEIKKLEESVGNPPSQAFLFAVSNIMDDMFGRRDSLQSAPSEDTIRDLKNSIKEMVSNNLVNKNDLFAAVMGADSTSFSKWDILKEYAVNDGGLPENMKKRLIGNMISNDSTAAVNSLLASADSNSSTIVDTMIDEWVAVDSGGATKWYTANQSNLSELQKNLVAEAFAKSALTSGEFDSARQWARQIQDSQLRIQRLEVIAKKEAEVSHK